MTAVPMSEAELAELVTESIRAAVAERGGVVLVPAEVAAELEQVRRENGRLREINAGLRAELEDLGERHERAIYDLDHMLEERKRRAGPEFTRQILEQAPPIRGDL